MKKMLSVILSAIMLLSVAANAVAATRLINYDAWCYMRDTLPGTTYAEKLFDADFAQTVQRKSGTIPQGLEVKKTMLPNSAQEVWALTGKTTAPVGLYKFKLACFDKDGAEKTAYVEIKVWARENELKPATQGVYYTAVLMRLPSGDGAEQIEWRLSEGGDGLPEGLELKEMQIDHGKGLCVCGVPEECGSKPFSVAYVTNEGEYQFEITYEIPVNPLELPASDECFINEVFDGMTEIPAGWETDDLDGDGKSFEAARYDAENPAGYIDILESVSGENGCDDVLYSPYFYTLSSPIEVCWKAYRSSSFEILYTTEDTLDLEHYTKIAECSTSARSKEILYFEAEEEAAPRFIRIAFRHKTDKVNDRFCPLECAVCGAFGEKFIQTDVGADVSKVIAEYPLEQTYKLIGEMPSWYKLTEKESGGKKTLTLEGKPEKLHADTFLVKICDKDNVLKNAVELTVKSGDFLFGDANLDGKLNTGDATAILRYAAGMITLSEDELYCADINRDGQTNTGDAVLILRIQAGM